MPKKEARGNQVTPSGPLHDVNVLDLGTAGVGPWAATLLGYLGARVIKLENPAGDRIRIQKPFINGVSTTYTVLNLNKKTSILDLKDQNLAEARDRLVGQADVAMDNVRPGLLERLALGYQRLKEINPNIVAVSSPAWGEEGPMRTLAGFDFQVQMFSGYASLNGRPGEVGQMARYPHLDFNAACFLASSALLGLIARERTHKGQRLVASHLGSALVLQLTRFAEYFATGQNPSPMGSASAASVPHQAFKSQNGAYVLVGVENEGQWQGFCTAIQHGELAQEPRFASNRQRVAHRQELIPILEKVFASKPARWWIFRLEGENVPCGYIHSFEDLRFHQHILENQFMKKIEVPHQLPIYVGGEPWVLGKTPARISFVRTPGQDTEEVITSGFGRKSGFQPKAKPEAEEGAPPLAGLLVLDATQGYAGPFAGLLLAEVGAEVVKVEPPGGDYTRGLAPQWHTGDAAAFAALNRNKQSVELDLDQTEGKKQFLTLAASAAVVVEDWGPGVAQRRGLDYSQLKRIRPDLVYCSLTPFGETGPLADRPGCELVVQGWSEYLQNLGAPGDPPERYGADIAGIGTGLMAFLGILAALYDRYRTGTGQRLSVSMLGIMMCLKSAHWAALTSPEQWEGHQYCNSEVRGRWYGYRTRDGAIDFNLDNSTEEQYLSILADLGMLEEIVADPRFDDGGRHAVGAGKYSTEVFGIWEKYMGQLPTSEVVETINRNGGVAVPMQRLDQVFEHPQIKLLDLLGHDDAKGAYIRAPWKGNWRAANVTPPPACGQHNGKVLR